MELITIWTINGVNFQIKRNFFDYILISNIYWLYKSSLCTMIWINEDRKIKHYSKEQRKHSHIDMKNRLWSKECSQV